MKRPIVRMFLLATQASPVFHVPALFHVAVLFHIPALFHGTKAFFLMIAAIKAYAGMRACRTMARQALSYPVFPMLAIRRPIVIASAALLCAAPFLARASPDADSSRGALLYETHCMTCHSVQVHWRDHSQVSDWESLTRQVDRWQANANLRWDANDIDAVSRYLDDAYYKLPARAAPLLSNRR